MNELVALFCGVEHEDGGWETAPYPSACLALEISRRIDPSSEADLRRALYGARPADELTYRAQMALETGFKRYREERGAEVR